MSVVSSRTWYTYTLASPDGTVFYVGKGTGKRIEEHEMEARGGCGCDKCFAIRKIWNDGGKVQKTIVLDGLEEAISLEYEKELILKYVGPALTNYKFNPASKEKKIDSHLISGIVFAEKIIDGVAYVPMKQLPLAFALSKQRLDKYLNHLSVARHRFPFDNRLYVFSSDIKRIKAFLVGLSD